LMPHPVLLVPSEFPDANAQKLITSGAAIGATAIPLTTATTQFIALGTMLDFGGVKFARVTADVEAGAVSIPVAALVAAVVNGDVAYANSFGRRTLLEGTLIGRTYAERTSKTGFGAADDTDDQVYLVAFTVDDVNATRSCTVVKPGTVIKENYLPEWTTIAADANLLAKLRSVYRCITGVD
jgi:hypothetical protein